VQRALPFVTLLSGVTKSVGDEECFGDIVVGVGAVYICKELTARRDDRVLEQSGATDRCSIILESRPRLSLSHAREQRIHAHAEDDQVFGAEVSHGSYRRAQDAPGHEQSRHGRFLEDIGEYLRTHSRRGFMAAPYPMNFGGARQSRLFCEIHAHIPAQAPGAP
jgi:hypothetical protein